ncbi:eCIS core domain-containing protein [Deinococcus multiflagellatus]|uniref:DUF4157 domain-containing protein n=1 Tax=Deinococcus multiflagellatus TaxID=1656887 RepID=A0ABW1ZRB4_9DEIO
MRAALGQTLGTGLDDVRVVQNVHVPAALNLAQADGLTVGRTVFLSPDTRLDTGAGMALAAHEATHAIRHQQPTFVPQVLRRQGAAPSPHDEEAVALGTEHATAREQAQARRPAPLDTPEAQRLPGLPAPWEPMPGWDDGAARQPAPAPAEPPAPPVQAAPPPNAALPTWAQAAAANRPAAGAPPPGAASSTPAVGRRAAAAPQVDLDQVAREVYARLRDRLGAELRRL